MRRLRALCEAQGAAVGVERTSSPGSGSAISRRPRRRTAKLRGSSLLFVCALVTLAFHKRSGPAAPKPETTAGKKKKKKKKGFITSGAAKPNLVLRPRGGGCAGSKPSVAPAAPATESRFTQDLDSSATPEEKREQTAAHSLAVALEAEGVPDAKALCAAGLRAETYAPFTSWHYEGDKAKALNAARVAAEKAAKAAAEAEDAAAFGTSEPNSDASAEASHNRGVTIKYLREFTEEHDCWDWPTWKVVRDIIGPATAATRCRYVDLPAVRAKANPGPAQTFGCARSPVSTARDSAKRPTRRLVRARSQLALLGLQVGPARRRARRPRGREPPRVDWCVAFGKPV